jgi:hypothetical protein
MRTELNALIDTLIAGGNATATGRTAVVTTAACAAVLGSASTLIQ